MVFTNYIDGRWKALRHLLQRYGSARQISTVYEAGYFGFWLYDLLRAAGVDVRVPPPSLIPQATGNRVKTDRRDSAKLAQLLQAKLLRSVTVPTPQQRAHRAVARRRRQLLGDRVRVQQRIKAELRFYGLDLAMPKGAWSKTFVTNLHRLRLADPWLQESFERRLAQYEFLCHQLEDQTAQLKRLADSEPYRDNVALLTSVPGIGWLAAIELLLELLDLRRFDNAEQLAAYVGLPPSQHSTGEHVRLGHITRQGKPAARAILIQAAWRLISHDPVMGRVFVRIKAHAGAKRAIVAVARRLIVRMRRLLLDQTPYAVGSLAG